MKRHFVKFMSPGTFVAEVSVKEIESWDVSKATEMVREITERCYSKPYGFQFFTKESRNDKIIQQSGTYYINGIITTLEELKAKNNPDNRILISNMESNGWDKIVTTYSPWKWTQPFGEGDCVINIKV